MPLGSIGLTIFGLDLALASMALPPVTREPPVAALLGQSAAVWRVIRRSVAARDVRRPASCRCMRWCNCAALRTNGRGSSPPTNIINAFSWWSGRSPPPPCSPGLSIPMLFAVAAICNAAVAVFIYGLVPEFLLRFLAGADPPLHRLKKRGVETYRTKARR